MLGGQDTVCTSHQQTILMRSSDSAHFNFSYPQWVLHIFKVHISLQKAPNAYCISPPGFTSLSIPSFLPEHLQPVLGVTSRKVLNSSKPGQCSKALRLAGRQVPLGQHLQPWSMDMQSKRSPFWMLLPLHKAERCPTSDPFSHKPHTEP